MGGWTSSVSRATYRYIKLDNRWEQKSNMSEGRSSAGCGRVINPRTGKEEVVVSGGYSSIPGKRATSTTEIYTVGNDTWREGPDLPQALYNLASLPYEDTFLILGGYDGSACFDSIYQVRTRVSFSLGRQVQI